MDNTATQTDFGQPSASARTIEQICSDGGVNVDTVRRACGRAGLTDFDKSLPPTDAQIQASVALQRALQGGATPEVKAVGKRNAPAKKAVAAVAITAGVEKAVKAAKGWSVNRRTVGLAIILLATMLVSWQNMYAVTGELFQESEAASFTLTGILCFSPFIFSTFGMAQGHIKALVICLGVFEGFCNVARIFGGLTGFSHVHNVFYTGKDGVAHTVATVTGCPTRFLGLVCDLFDSGTVCTAKVLAGLLSGLIFWLFYTALFGLKK